MPPDGRSLDAAAGTDSKKKSIHAAEQQRPDVKQQREDWMDTLTGACGGDYSRVLFIDESGAVTNLIRSHGRSLAGSRCLAYAPNGHWKVMTAVAAIRLSGMTAAATMACPMDGALFQTYLHEGLLPTLSVGDVVVMDNLASHKHPRVRELIESAGARLLYLPPYSPDFNPIEMIWSKVKRLLRSAAARRAPAAGHAPGGRPGADRG